MANNFYNRGANFNPDELADGDAIEAEFDAVSRGFDTIEDLVNANKSGYPTKTFYVAPATESTQAVQKSQLDSAVNTLNSAVGLKLAAASYTASDVLAKVKAVDGSGSGLDSDLLDGQEGSYYRNASNINSGTLPKERLPVSIDSDTTGTASKATYTVTGANAADLVYGVMADNDMFRIRIGGSASNSGWVEIATADDGAEPIYVSQYKGNFTTLVRTLTLLDGSGNTTLPGTLAVPLVNDNSRVGEVCAFARTSAPSGFLKCNGAAISRTTYAALFAVIGTTFGVGDGSTTFNLPDLRGEFIRGWDDARGIDTSRVFGSWQDGQNVSHTHTATVSSYAHIHTWSGTTSSDGAHTHTITVRQANDLNWNSTPVIPGSDDYAASNTTNNSTASAGVHNHTVSGTTSTDSHTHTVTNAASGGTEVRVRNCALLYCIKY